jgi:hypothetical protein
MKLCIYSSIISLLALLLPTAKTFAQADSLEAEQAALVDSLAMDSMPKGEKKKFRLPLNSISFGAEVGKTFVNTTLLDGRSFQMFGGNLQLYRRYFIALDIGRESYEIDDHKQYYYKGTGGFWRLGFDYDILNKEGGAIVVGMRYGNAFTHVESQFTLTDEYWGDVEESIDEVVNSHWVEGHIGLRADLPLGFQAGISGRLTQILYNSRGRSMTPFRIPGFGDGLNNNTSILEYYILYRIPLQRKKKKQENGGPL